MEWAYKDPNSFSVDMQFLQHRSSHRSTYHSTIWDLEIRFCEGFQGEGTKAIFIEQNLRWCLLLFNILLPVGIISTNRRNQIDFNNEFRNQLNESRPIISWRNLIYTTIENTSVLLLDAIQPNDAEARISKERISEFYTSGYLNVVLNWLNSGAKESAESITEDLFIMTFENLYHLLNQSLAKR